MPVVQIRVLGPLDIHLENGDVLAFESIRARALLAYLAVEAGQFHSRKSVAGLLWPDRPDSAALANLRHTLSSVRMTLGERLKEQARSMPLLHISPNTLQFNLGANAWVDLGEFEGHLATAEREGKEDLQTRILHLSAAVQLNSGLFMEGFSLKGCPEFEDWMLLRRENVSLKFQKALRSLAAAHESAGAWELALSALRQLLQLESWDESAHRKVMALLAIHDQRSAALNQYEHCRQVLWDELGVEPEEETRRLYERIRQGRFSEPAIKGSDGTGVGIRRAKPPRTRFVGRQPQLAKLRRALDLALDGSGQVIFITGEAGSGKTSLAWEFAYQAMDWHKNLLAAAGRCNAITGFEDPYLPFREIVQMLVGTHETRPAQYFAPEHLRRLTEAFPDIIKSLLAFGPDLIGSFIPIESLAQRIETFGPGKYAWQREFKQVREQAAAGLPSPSLAASLISGQLTHQPMESVIRMLIGLARHRPLILFLDDLQWADAGSVSLLHYLCKCLAGSRVVVLGAYRPQDTALGRRASGITWERHPLEPVRLELQRGFGEMDVDLDQPEGMAFVEALVDIEPNCLGEPFRQTLYRQTNGNPLFTLELLRSMQERGGLVRDQSGRWVEGPQLDWEKLPARVEAVIAERLGRLPPLQQALLRVASVEGETFTAEVAAVVLGQEEHQVISWLSGSLSREQQIVSALDVRRPGSPEAGQSKRLSRYRFNHFLFRRYLYNRLDPVERSALHEATGIALENRYGLAAEEMALLLSWHFQQAGMLARAVEYLLVAGKQAINLAAHSQAKALYDRCLGLIQQLPESPERTRLEIQVQLARGAPSFAAEGWGSPQAVRAVNRAVELLEQSSGHSADSSILLALYFQADHFTAQNNMTEALARVELLLQRISTGVEHSYRTLAFMMAGQVYLFAGQPVAAADYLEKAISSYHPEDQPLLTGVAGRNVLYTCLVWNAWAHWILGHPTHARALSRQAIELARQQAHSFDLAISLAVGGALFYSVQNEPEQAGAYARECLRLPDPGNLRMGKILSQTALGWVQVKQGEFENGLTLLRTGIEAWKATGALTIMPLDLMLLADALSLAGQTGEALEIVSTLTEMIEQTGRRAFEAYLYWLQGEILAREQRRALPGWQPDLSPVACFERSIETACRQQARSIELRATSSLARHLWEAGQAGEAFLRLKKIYTHFEAECGTQDLNDAQKLLAELSGSMNSC